MSIQVLKPFYRTPEILEHIKECCDSSWTGNGFKTDDFELAWKKYTEFDNASFLNSATAALHLAIMQLKNKFKWSEDSECISTPITFISTNHAILYNNLISVFADIDKYGCLDPQSVEKNITSKTKLIIFVGLGGNIGNLFEIIKIAKKYNLKLILDAAHCSGTRLINGEHIGIQEGITATCFSYQSVKNLCTFDSGSLCWGKDKDINSLAMEKETKELAWLGIDKSTHARSSSVGAYKWNYSVDKIGYKYHSSSIAACFGLVGLKYLEQDNAYRRYLCEIYIKNLEGIVEIVPTSLECISSRHLFQILVDKRDEAMLALNQAEIYPGVHYHDNTNYSMYSYAKGKCPIAAAFSNRTITLPLHIHLTVEDIKYIAEKLKEIIIKKS